MFSAESGESVPGLAARSRGRPGTRQADSVGNRPDPLSRPRSRHGPATCFVNGTVILPDRLIDDGIVTVHRGRIKKVGRRRDVRPTRDAVIIDAQRGFIAPGFVDIHVHGGDGADYMDGTAEAVRTANRCHARHGTTTIFPTTTTGSHERDRARCSMPASTVQRRVDGRRRRTHRRRALLRAVLRGGQGRLPSEDGPPRSGSRRSTAATSTSASSGSPRARRSCPAPRRSIARPARRRVSSPAATRMRPGRRWRGRFAPACGTSITSGAR